MRKPVRWARCATWPGLLEGKGDLMKVIYILWLRQLKRFVRSRSRVIASFGQPLLYLLAMGYGLGPVFRQAGQGSYLQFITPGVIAMTVMFASVFSGIELLWD